MIITAIAYATEDESQLTVTTSDQSVLGVPNLEAGDPNRTQHNSIVDAWLAVPGHEITAWVDPVDYMAKMRGERDRLIDTTIWVLQRNQRQIARGDTPTDNPSKMAEWYTYWQALADMPQNNPNIDTKTKYDALIWPTKPS